MKKDEQVVFEFENKEINVDEFVSETETADVAVKTETPKKDSKKKNKSTLFIAIGAVVLVIAMVIMIVVLKERRDNTIVINKDMLLAIILAELIFWLPCIIVVVLAVAVDPMWWAVFGAIILFWCAPFTPGWAIQIGLALIIKRVITRLKKLAKEAR